MSFAYITADKIGIETGGGVVTKNESEALAEFAEFQELVAITKLGRDELIGGFDPWGWDEVAIKEARYMSPKLTHFYSGSFSKTVKYLKENGCKVVYTCAAHRVSDSKKAHEDFGIQYNYPHLTDPDQWQKYSAGYRDADVLVAPSKHSELVLREQGCTNKIVVIPHGCEVQEEIKPIPSTFTVGYLGSNVSGDKGVWHLLEAWKKLKYKNALLILGGKDSTSDGMINYMLPKWGGGNVFLGGWYRNISDFYNKISLYIQPSRTEAFGIEVLEAMSFGRPVLCSDHAGACDVVPHESMKFQASNSDELAKRIDEAKKKWDLAELGRLCHKEAKKYTWDLIRERYKKVWTEVLEN